MTWLIRDAPKDRSKPILRKVLTHSYVCHDTHTNESFILIFWTGPSSRRDETIMWIQNLQKKDQLYREGSFCSTLKVDKDCYLWKFTENNFHRSIILFLARRPHGHAYEWVMSRIWMSHVTHMPVCGASKARMSHFTHIYESFHTHANASPMWGANRACLAEWKCCCINAANPLACRFGVGAVFICEVEKGEGVRSKHAHTLHPHLHTHTYAHVWAHAHNHKRTQTEYRG